MAHFTFEKVKPYYKDVLDKMTEKQKEGFVELCDKIDCIVDAKIKAIDYYLSMTFSEEQLAFISTLELLSDGKPKSWSELERSAGISTATLSRKLKIMTERGWVRRKVIPAFPPRTVYELNIGDPGFKDLFTKVGKVLKERRKVVFNTIWGAVRSDQFRRERGISLMLDTTFWVKENLFDIYSTVLLELKSLLSLPLKGTHPSQVPIWVAIPAILIMQCFWTAYEALVEPEERRLEAIDLLLAKYKEEREKLEPISEEELIRRVLGMNPTKAIQIANKVLSSK